MHKHRYFSALLAILFLLVTHHASLAQVGCPGCNVSLPVLPTDTIYLGTAPDGEAGQPYDGDVSFRMPKTTTPVNASDPSTPAGLPINQIDIVAVVNVPPGLNWQASQLSFNPNDQTDGCVKFCGTPLQPGLYNIEVFVTASVLGLNQSTSFSFPMYIAPASVSNAGFEIQNAFGCGTVTSNFINNLPSNGDSGYSYEWDFGNGLTSSEENPGPVVYNVPGTYDVNFSASIDTFGYKLTTVRVLDTGCDDLIINTAPDLYVKIRDPLGNFVVITGVLDNASFPAAFNINLPLVDGTYELEVRDEDTFGSESCGYVYFTKNTTSTIISGELEVQVDIIHPVQSFQSSGVVTVYPQPASPIIQPDASVELCEGENVELITDYDQNLQWYRDTSVLFGEIYQNLYVEDSGEYWVEYTSPDGCKAQSDPVSVDIFPLPLPPVFTAVGNEYSVAEPSLLPSSFSLQWYLDGNIAVDETGLTYCLMEPGTHLVSLVVTDNETGCNNEFSLGVNFDPAYTCASSTKEGQQFSDLSVWPNPVAEKLQVQFNLDSAEEVSYTIFTAQGEVVASWKGFEAAGNVTRSFPVSDLTAGFYLLSVRTSVQAGFAKVTKM